MTNKLVRLPERMQARIITIDPHGSASRFSDNLGSTGLLHSRIRLCCEATAR